MCKSGNIYMWVWKSKSQQMGLVLKSMVDPGQSQWKDLNLLHIMLPFCMWWTFAQNNKITYSSVLYSHPVLIK